MQHSDTAAANAFGHAFDDPGTAEHVMLEADEAVLEDDASPPSHVVRQTVVKDRARRVETELALYDNGKLDIVRRRRGKSGTPQSVDLTYLDPVPETRRSFATRAGRATLVAAAVAVLATTLAGFGVAGAVTVPVAAVAWLGAAAMGFAFVRMSTETVVFVTRHGRAAAVTLTATLGSFTPQRKAVPLIGAAIKAARARVGENTQAYLKSEMREHYRLRGEGLLSAEDCSTGTARVLRHFDAAS